MRIYSGASVCMLYFDWRFGDPFIIINTITKTWTKKRLFTVAIVHRHRHRHRNKNTHTKQQQQNYGTNMKKKRNEKDRESNGDEFVCMYNVRVRKRNKTSLEKLNILTQGEKTDSFEPRIFLNNSLINILYFDSIRSVLFSCLSASAKLSLSVPLLRWRIRERTHALARPVINYFMTTLNNNNNNICHSPSDSWECGSLCWFMWVCD